MEVNKDVGVAIVHYDTPDLLVAAVKSVAEHVGRVVIIDGSPEGTEGYDAAGLLEGVFPNVECKHVKDNIGHGPGLNMAIDMLDTEYIICMDSDAELLDSSLIGDMKEALKGDDVYGSGWVLTLKSGKPYLHLPFCMFKKTSFEAHPKFIHGGAPFINTMKVIHKKGLRLADIPNYQERLRHEGRGTRIHNPEWRRSFGGRDGV
ncbi:MAG: glycosyltransferase [Anaerovoracaceae bacterium]